MQTGHASLLAALAEFAWPAKAAAELARGAHIVPYERHSTIFAAGEAADLVYVLISGEVRLQFDAGGGAGLLVSIARAGQMLGVFAVDGGGDGGSKPEQLFTAQALSRCKVAIIPTARIAQGLLQLPANQLVSVLERSREQWVQLCRRLLVFLTMSVRTRLTHTLSEIAEHFGVSDAHGRLITLRLSHEDFAALIGASRPMVSKHLKELENDGVLSREQGRYRMLKGDRELDGNDLLKRRDGGRTWEPEQRPARVRRPAAGGEQEKLRGGSGGRLHPV